MRPTPRRGAWYLSMRSRTLLALLAGVILGSAARWRAACWPSGRWKPDRRRRIPARSPLPWQEASLFAEVYERIKRDYVDDVDDHALMEKAVRGMVAALDPHSAYLDSEEFDDDPPLAPWAPTPALASRSPPRTAS